MKNPSSRFYVLLLLNIFSLCLCSQLFGQQKINISIGIGFPESINTSLRYLFPEHVQLGLGIGFMPEKKGSFTCYSGIAYFHFGKLPKLSNLRPWYSRISLDYLRDKGKNGYGEPYNDKYLYADLRIGRDLCISKKIGIEVDAGIMFDLIKQPLGWFNMSIAPGIGIRLYYRL